MVLGGGSIPLPGTLPNPLAHKRNEDGKVNMTAEKRATAFVRKLRVGDKFVDDEGTWEVTRAPVVKYGNQIHISLLPVPRRRGVRPYSQSYVYKDIDLRVKIVH